MTLLRHLGCLAGLMFLAIPMSRVSARELPVGPAQMYTTLSSALAVVQAGDTIVLSADVHSGGAFASNVHGLPDAPIVIRGVDMDRTIIRGGTSAMQLSSISWVILENFTVEGQTGNGINIDDGGSITQPSHHVTVRQVRCREMNATGNNDLLKLSGLDTFVIERCVFENGAAGGSGADMVGCHEGVFRENTFTALGSNAIQAKGGTSHIVITQNLFTNCGQRALNLGGSTGLQFFRPANATYEAADIQVHANVFIGSVAPIAYVGSTRVEVVNNTIFFPQRWALRILQETVDITRFVPCGDNTFANNLIVTDGSMVTHCNVGANTDAESFRFQTNWWYDVDNPTRTPSLPVTETGSVSGQDPQIQSIVNRDGRLVAQSPLRGAGTSFGFLTTDASGRAWSQPPSIGAFEYASTSSVAAGESGPVDNHVVLFSRMSGNALVLPSFGQWTVYDVSGRFLERVQFDQPMVVLTEHWPAVTILVKQGTGNGDKP